MRPIEIALATTNLLALFALAIPRLHRLRGIALVGLLVALLHGVIEGVRWQMVPAYLLTGLFTLFWLLDIGLPGRVRVNRFLSILGVGAGTLVLAISVALPSVLPVFHFPKPSGAYAIGTMTYHLVDTSRPELFTADPHDHRELMIQVWYPAENRPGKLAPYFEDADAVTTAMARLTHLPAFIFHHFKYVTTNALVSAPIAADRARYPVLIYLTGVDGSRAVNTFQVEALVSHGYIVVGLDQPGAVASVTFPDGRQITGWSRDALQPLIMQSVEPRPEAPMLYEEALPNGIIPYLAQDVSFTLDQLAEINRADPNHLLTGHLDLERTGTFGVSLGGMNAAESCRRDARLKSCLIMDVWMPADVVEVGLQQPSMFITRDADTMRLERQRAGGWSESDIALTLNTMRSV
jgi:predicted dienelactone hydrolase